MDPHGEHLSRRLLRESSLVLLTAFLPASESVATLAFYEIRPAPAAITLDGRLDEAAWAAAAPATAYYEYAKADPGPGALSGGLRMLYDTKGIYLGIVNHEDHPERLRAACTARDDPRIWMDDCAEIFVDPLGQGVGFVKFMVNPLGTQADFKRVDAAISLPNWNGNGWRAAVDRQSDAWTIEIFLPWEDLERRAAPGDLWRFCHVRYAYTTGSFQGVTWAPGGGNNQPQNFGYIHFGGPTPLNTDQVGGLLARTASPPWNLLAGDQVVSCRQAGTATRCSAASLVEAERQRVATAFARTDAVLAGRARTGIPAIDMALPEARATFTALPAGGSDAVAAMSLLRRLARLGRTADDAYWEARTLQLPDRSPDEGTKP